MMITDFTPSSWDLGWYVQNGNVMGGKSEGKLKLAAGEVLLTGSTKTGGGAFNAILTKSIRLGLSSYTGIRLPVIGDGRRYTWHL